MHVPMCIDFCDLNKTCPKDYYILPRIEKLVDSTQDVKCYQLWMHIKDTRLKWIKRIYQKLPLRFVVEHMTTSVCHSICRMQDQATNL